SAPPCAGLFIFRQAPVRQTPAVRSSEPKAAAGCLRFSTMKCFPGNAVFLCKISFPEQNQPECHQQQTNASDSQTGSPINRFTWCFVEIMERRQDPVTVIQAQQLPKIADEKVVEQIQPHKHMKPVMKADQKGGQPGEQQYRREVVQGAHHVINECEADVL